MQKRFDTSEQVCAPRRWNFSAGKRLLLFSRAEAQNAHIIKANSIGEPTIAIEKTEALRDGWVTSGRVTYPVDGARANGTVLEFSFKDASNKNEAIQQSLSDVEILIDALSATVERLRQGERPNGEATARADLAATAAE